MLFNSFEFVLFFPVVSILYFLLPHRYRTFLLLAASFYFYAFFKWEYTAILVFTIVVDYFAGIWISQNQGKKRKWALGLSLLANIGVLAIFKYYTFALDTINFINQKLGSTTNYTPIWQILLPVGLSFHTFQAMSYTIEVYRGNQAPERNFWVYSLYVMFYPQLVAGPIERPQNVIWQFYEKHSFDYQMAKTGLRLMLWGIFKKVVIADNLSLFVDQVYGNVHGFSGLPFWVATVFYSMQIYCDFSGYSDIAIGSARFMGFDLMKNFNRPYIATSISDFWRRWHISLSTWFRDYVYIPLGGNRSGFIRKYFNLFFVFMLSGLWHGNTWNFVFWGALHGVYLIAGQITQPLQEKVFKKSVWGQIVQWCMTFGLVNFAWIFFRSRNWQDSKYIIKKLFATNSHSLAQIFDLIGYKELIVAAVGILILQIGEYTSTHRNVDQWLAKKPKAVEWGIYYVLLFIILGFGYFGEVQFIYFQF
ncbi:MAG: MBOAT family O-acyltransferase [Leadbetterella sp.]